MRYKPNLWMDQVETGPSFFYIQIQLCTIYYKIINTFVSYYLVMSNISCIFVESN